jgi:hypothetical protein
MAFDLYFAGARNNVADKYLLESGAHRLQSQLIDRKNIMHWVCTKSDSSKLFIDSGAYTAYTKGIKIDVNDYIRYINSISAKCTIFAQLDTIPGQMGKPKTKDERLNAPRLSWENYLYMRERLLEPEKLIPIFHQGENYEWLWNMLEWTDERGKHIPYIGISPAVDVSGLDDFLTKSFDIISKSSNPSVKTHAFGMTQLKVLESYPYTSADSTSWKLSAAMGNIYTPWGIVYVSDRYKGGKSFLHSQPSEAVTKLINYIEDCGFTFEQVAKFDYVRYIVNIKYLMNWAKNYKYRGGVKRKRLF